jgi:hypothetical protein
MHHEVLVTIREWRSGNAHPGASLAAIRGTRHETAPQAAYIPSFLADHLRILSRESQNQCNASSIQTDGSQLRRSFAVYSQICLNSRASQVMRLERGSEAKWGTPQHIPGTDHSDFQEKQWRVGAQTDVIDRNSCNVKRIGGQLVVESWPRTFLREF